MATFTPALVLKAFQATGIHPPDAQVILKRFPTTYSDQGSDNSDSSDTSQASTLSTWIKIHRRFKEVVIDPSDPRTKELAQVLHHLVVQNELLRDQNIGLQESLKLKENRGKPKRALQVEDPEEYYGGAVWWSPRRIQRDRDLQEQAELDKQHDEQERVAQREARKAIREEKARVVTEGKALRLAARIKKQQETAAAKALRIHLRNQAALAKKQRLSKPRSKPKPASKPRPKTKPVVGAAGDADAGGGESAPPASPPTSRSGRSINLPKRYRNM